MIPENIDSIRNVYRLSLANSLGRNIAARIALTDLHQDCCHRALWRNWQKCTGNWRPQQA